ncbi:TadE/TadG family type IV pilus assembly protein [Flexivirga sp. B27]
MRLTRHTAHRDRGASLVEFAIVLPLFLVLIGGIVDFGRALFTEITLTNAAREGARSAMYGTSPLPRAGQAAGSVPGAQTSNNTCPQGATTGDVTVTVKAPFQWIVLGPALNLIPGASNTLPDHLTGKATMQCGG